MRVGGKGVLLAFVLGAGAAVAGVLANEAIDRRTSTDEFCGSSCHSMQANVASDPVYLESAHRTSSTGVVAGCADCHLPSGLVARSWAHVSAGVRDVISETTHDFSRPEAWEAERPRLAHAVREWMLDTDSATCRGCHREDAIQPGRKRGQRQHEEAREEGITCIACHYNLVHAEVEPTDAFFDRAEPGRAGR